MNSGWMGAIVAFLVITSGVSADVVMPRPPYVPPAPPIDAPPEFRGRQPKAPTDAAPKQRLVISRDPQAKSARLVMPSTPSAALRAPEQTGGLPFAGLAFTGALVAGGLWCVRPHASNKQVLVMLMLALMLGSLGLAQTASADIPPIPGQPRPPRPRHTPQWLQPIKIAPVQMLTTIETGKVQISRNGSAPNIQLILPKKTVAPATK